MVLSASPVKRYAIAILLATLLSGCALRMPTPLGVDSTHATPANSGQTGCDGLVCLVSRTLPTTVPALAYGQYPSFTQVCVDRFLSKRGPNARASYFSDLGSDDRVNLLLEGESKFLAQKQNYRIERLQFFLNYSFNRGTNRMDVTITLERAGELYHETWGDNEFADSMFSPIGPKNESDLEAFLKDLTKALHDCGPPPSS